MKIIKKPRLLILIALALSTQVNSFEQTEPDSINKKDVVDEVIRSEIESDELTETPKIENIMPIFEIPKLKVSSENVKKSNGSHAKSRTLKKVVKKSIKKKLVAQRNLNESQVIKSKSVTRSTEKAKKQTNKQYRRRVVSINKSLKPHQLLLNDVIISTNAKLFIERSKGKYIYTYQYKHNIPFQSKGLKLIKPNHYMIVDAELLAKDIAAFNTPEQLANEIKIIKVSDELLLKRKGVEKKINKGHFIDKSINISDLYKGDVIYIFGEVQVVIRKKRGMLFLNKYWLFPTIDTENSSLDKIGKGKYRVKKAIK